LASGKSANPQTFNRYVYVLNSPLVLTDPEGLQAGTSGAFRYDVYFRTFAPFDWFGGFGLNAFVGDGNARAFSTALTGPNSSYRMSAVSQARATNDGTQYPEVRTFAQPASRSYNYYFNYEAPSECHIDNYNWQTFGDGANYHMYGNDDAVIDSENFNPAWDIDINPTWSATYSDFIDGQTIMNITGGATGDGFPALESFVYDAYGNGVMLGVYAVPRDGWGPEPETRLAGDNLRPMLRFDVNIVVREGRFVGVLIGRGENEEVISIEDWNRRYTSQPTRQDDVPLN
jgi:hypothetical protein